MPATLKLISPLFIILFSHFAFAANPPTSLEDEVIQTLTGVLPFQGSRIHERGKPRSRELSRQYLSQKLQQFGLTPSTHQYSRSSANLYTIIPATNGSKEYVILGAHYDSVGNAGANDNASGVAIVLSMAWYMNRVKHRSKNLLFVFLDEEENGLRGAYQFAKFLRSKRYQVQSVHTIDQMGWDRDGDRAIEIEMPSQRMWELYQRVNSSSPNRIPLHRTRVTTTDHQAFRESGFEAVGLTEEYVNGDTTPCYHKRCDTYDTINFEYLYSSRNFWIRVILHLVSS